jgi:hypothetical protein
MFKVNLFFIDICCTFALKIIDLIVFFNCLFRSMGFKVLKPIQCFLPNRKKVVNLHKILFMTKGFAKVDLTR